MIQTPPEMRGLTHQLSVATWTLATIGVLFDSGLADHLREPRSVNELAELFPRMSASRIERCLAVAKSVGVVLADGPRFRLADGAAAFLQPPMRAALLGDLRTTFFQAAEFLEGAKNERDAGWRRHTRPEVLQAQGDASSVLPQMFKANLVASMGDLGTRLEQPGARFLDVGVGVGALSIGMCRGFPALHAVGIDPYDAPLAIARENIRSAGLEGRIELRSLTVEELAEEGAFDLAWIPTFFMPEAILTRATARVHAALRPGGWVLYPASLSPSASEQNRASFALLTDLWGGSALSVERAEALLTEAGFTEVRALPGPPWAPAMIIGRR